LLPREPPTRRAFRFVSFSNDSRNSSNVPVDDSMVTQQKTRNRRQTAGLAARPHASPQAGSRPPATLALVGLGLDAAGHLRTQNGIRPAPRALGLTAPQRPRPRLRSGTRVVSVPNERGRRPALHVHQDLLTTAAREFVTADSPKRCIARMRMRLSGTYRSGGVIA
jgi:hypothetical protein